MSEDLGVAVIGAGMAGKAHAAGYRAAATLYSPVLPPIRLVAIADVNEPVAATVAQRYGYQRHETSWQAIAAAEDIDVVSVVVANSLHREIVEGLLAAGKHVLCEKPLSDSLDDARAMAAAAAAASPLARIGFTYLRAPGVAFIGQLIDSGELGRVLHFAGRYWCDYSANPQAPMSWRYQGGPGSGALADIGSHLSYLAEFLCGPAQTVSGGVFSTAITQRPKAIGYVSGHEQAEVSDELEPVGNDDYAAYTAQFANGPGTVEVSRVATGHVNSLQLEVFCENGSARFDQLRASEIGLALTGPARTNGYRQVILGSQHPYVSGGMPMDVAGVGFGQNEGFYYQARAFLEEVAGIDKADSLPRCPSLAHGVHNMELLAAVAKSAATGGAAVAVPEILEP